MNESLREDREQETTSLAGTSLGAGHEITAAHDDRNGVLLDGGGHLVPSHLDVGDQVVIKRWVTEGQDRLGNIMSGSLDGDVIVLLEVDAGVLLGGIGRGAEELTLHAGVSRARNVLSVAPLPIAGAPSVSSSTTTTTAAGVVTRVATVSIGVETSLGTTVALSAPGGGITTLMGRGTIKARSGGAGRRPVAATSVEVTVVTGRLSVSQTRTKHDEHTKAAV